MEQRSLPQEPVWVLTHALHTLPWIIAPHQQQGELLFGIADASGFLTGNAYLCRVPDSLSQDPYAKVMEESSGVPENPTWAGGKRCLSPAATDADAPAPGVAEPVSRVSPPPWQGGSW